MIIDAHHHLWDPADRPYPWMDASVAAIRRRFDVDDLRRVSRGTDVTTTIVVQAVHDAGETAWLLRQSAPVAGVVGWVDVTAPDVADRVAALRVRADGATGDGATGGATGDGATGGATGDGATGGATGDGASSDGASSDGASSDGASIGHRLVGIRHQAQDEPDPDWLARPDVARGVRALAQAGLVFDLLVREREHHAALALVDTVPEASFVLDHAGKPPIAEDSPEVAAAWRARMRDFAARPNVVCKVSGLLTEAGASWRDRPVARYAREAVEHFGPARSLFGSDWPVSTLATGYAEVLRTTGDALADLTPDERDAVFRGTAERVYLAATPTQT